MNRTKRYDAKTITKYTESLNENVHRFRLFVDYLFYFVFRQWKKFVQQHRPLGCSVFNVQCSVFSIRHVPCFFFTCVYSVHGEHWEMMREKAVKRNDNHGYVADAVALCVDWHNIKPLLTASLSFSSSAVNCFRCAFPMWWACEYVNC